MIEALNGDGLMKSNSGLESGHAIKRSMGDIISCGKLEVMSAM